VIVDRDAEPRRHLEGLAARREVGREGPEHDVTLRGSDRHPIRLPARGPPLAIDDDARVVVERARRLTPEAVRRSTDDGATLGVDGDTRRRKREDAADDQER
jgi:hypothetical protein